MERILKILIDQHEVWPALIVDKLSDKEAALSRTGNKMGLGR